VGSGVGSAFAARAVDAGSVVETVDVGTEVGSAFAARAVDAGSVVETVDVGTGVGSVFAARVVGAGSVVGTVDVGTEVADGLMSGSVVTQPIRKTKRQIHNSNFLFNISKFLIMDVWTLKSSYAKNKNQRWSFISYKDMKI
jgi:hypothetical protein